MTTVYIKSWIILKSGVTDLMMKIVTARYGNGRNAESLGEKYDDKLTRTYDSVHPECPRFHHTPVSLGHVLVLSVSVWLLV